ELRARQRRGAARLSCAVRLRTRPTGPREPSRQRHRGSRGRAGIQPCFSESAVRSQRYSPAGGHQPFVTPRAPVLGVLAPPRPRGTRRGAQPLLSPPSVAGSARGLGSRQEGAARRARFGTQLHASPRRAGAHGGHRALVRSSARSGSRIRSTLASALGARSPIVSSSSKLSVPRRRRRSVHLAPVRVLGSHLRGYRARSESELLLEPRPRGSESPEHRPDTLATARREQRRRTASVACSMPMFARADWLGPLHRVERRFLIARS